jgi:hypothetical protein
MVPVGVTRYQMNYFLPLGSRMECRCMNCPHQIGVRTPINVLLLIFAGAVLLYLVTQMLDRPLWEQAVLIVGCGWVALSLGTDVLVRMGNKPIRPGEL